MYSVQCTLPGVCTVYILHCLVYVQCTVYTAWFMYSVQCTLLGVLFDDKRGYLTIFGYKPKDYTYNNNNSNSEARFGNQYTSSMEVVNNINNLENLFVQSVLVLN